MAEENRIWHPGADFVERTNIYRFMHSLGFSSRERFLQFSHEQPELFWDQMVKEVGIERFVPYKKVMDVSRGVEWSQWFSEGRLNIAQNCLDRHAKGSLANRVACIGESERGDC